MYYYIKGKYGNGDDYLDDRCFLTSDDAYHIIDVLEKFGFYDLCVRISFNKDVKTEDLKLRDSVESYLNYREPRSDSNMTYNERLQKEFSHEKTL